MEAADRMMGLFELLYCLGDEETGTRQNEAVGHVIPQDGWRHPPWECLAGMS